MLSNTFVALLSAISLSSSVAFAAPIKATSTKQSVNKRQAPGSLDVTVIAYAQVSALGLQVSTDCIAVQVAADLGLPAVQEAVDAVAEVGLDIGQIVTADICASVNNRVPTCDATDGCGSGACLPGFQESAAGTCEPIVTQNPALDAQVLASVDVNLGGIVGLSTQCLLVDASLDLGLTAIQNAISAAAQVELGVGNLVDVDLCLSINNRVPICDSVNGCGLGGCLPGFVLDPATNTCVVAPPVGPSQLRRRTTVARRTLCPSPNETACSLSGRGKLSNSAVVSHQYECVDLSSSIESCGVCGNVCMGAGVGCQDGVCVEMD